MTEIDNLLSMLGVDKLSDEKQDRVKELLKKIIDKWRAGENSEAYVVLNGMFAQLKLDTLDEEARTEIKDKFMQMISREAGFSVKDFIWNTGQGFNNPLKSNLKENFKDSGWLNIKETTSSSDAVGPDSNLQGDIYSRVKGNDGLSRRKPKKRDYDEDEEEVILKLNALRKLFQNRNQKDISIDDIKKVLTSESEEQIFSAKQYINEAIKMARTVGNDKAMNYYFTESSPITSTFSHSAWSAFKYVHLSKDFTVTATNSFLVKVGNTLSKERIIELQNIGIKIYFKENLTEGKQNKNELIKALANLLEWAKGNRGSKSGNPYLFPEVKNALKVLGKLQGVNYLDVDTKKLSEALVSEAYQANDNLMDDLTYDELLTMVYSNIEDPSEKDIMREFEKIIKIKVNDARYEMKKAVKQIKKDIQND